MTKLFHIPLFAFFSFLVVANGCVIKCPETLNGDITFIPSPFDCSKFYVCANSDPVEMTCPDGLWFNTEFSKCDYPENVKCNNGYDLTCEYSCDGEIIGTWDDGSDSNYGTMKDIYSCKEECDKHEECGGFSMIPSSGICGHWKRGPITLTQKWGTDRDCYMKKD